MTSRNVKIIAKGEVVCITETLENLPLKEGEILIRNEASLISTGTELSRVYGLKKGVVYPVYPGYASIGIVEETRPFPDGKAQYKRGDRVLYSGPHRELVVYNSAAMNSHGVKEAINGYSMVKLDSTFDWLSSVDASIIHLGLIAMNGILPAELKLGDTICIFGLGIVGLLTALLYQASGAHVLGIDSVENRASHARNAGLCNVISAQGGDQVKAVTQFFGKDADITVDATGRSEGIINAIMCCGENGQVLLLGSPRTDYTCNITEVLNRLHMKMITLIGAMNMRYPFHKKEGSRESIERNLATFVDLIKKGYVEPGKIISHVVKPEAAMEAYDGLYNRPETYHCVVFDWKTEK